MVKDWKWAIKNQEIECFDKIIYLRVIFNNKERTWVKIKCIRGVWLLGKRKDYHLNILKLWTNTNKNEKIERNGLK